MGIEVTSIQRQTNRNEKQSKSKTCCLREANLATNTKDNDNDNGVHRSDRPEKKSSLCATNPTQTIVAVFNPLPPLTVPAFNACVRVPRLRVSRYPFDCPGVPRRPNDPCDDRCAVPPFRTESSVALCKFIPLLDDMEGGGTKSAGSSRRQAQTTMGRMTRHTVHRVQYKMPIPNINIWASVWSSCGNVNSNTSTMSETKLTLYILTANTFDSLNATGRSYAKVAT